jgi:hypothetical protein
MPVTQKHEQYVFLLGHYFASKSHAAVCEAFINAYPEREVLNKTAVH